MADNYVKLPSPLAPDAPREDRDRQEAALLGFCSEGLREAEIGVQATEGYSKIIPTMQAIMGVNVALRPTNLSHTAVNEVGRLAAVMRAELTDVKPSAEYKTFNDQLAQNAENMGKMWTSWYYNQGIDMRMGGVIDYALVAGSGYAHQIWNKFTQDMDVIPYDARDVLPLRPIDNSIQSCYGLFLRREMTVQAVRAQFPHYASQIKEDRAGTTVKLTEVTRSAVMDTLVGKSPFERAQLMSQPQETRNAGVPVVDLFYLYINDPSINKSSQPMYVGDFYPDKRPRNNYSYVVPPGKPLFPRKRLIIFTRTCVLYDGPNYYWHGMFPVSKYSINPWQWTWLGHTPLWDCLPLQDTLNRLLRAGDDHIQKLLRPPVAGDRTSVNMGEIKAISEMLRQPGAAWLRNPMGQGVEVIKVEPLDPIFADLIQYCSEKMAQQCGVTDMSALLGLNQLPEGNTIDKLMFATKPETRSRSRMLELFYREQGKMFMYNAAQFITTRRKFALLGPNGMTVDEYDFDPATFIPNASGDPANRYEEAEQYLRQFQFYVAPSSLLRSAQTQDQMMALALFRDGALDVQSLLERLDWPNIQKIMERLGQQQQLQMMMAMGAQGGAGAPGMGNQLGGDPRGRPPSGQEPPSLRGSDGYMEES